MSTSKCKTLILMLILFAPKPLLSADVNTCFIQLMNTYNSFTYSRNNHESFFLGYISLSPECQSLLSANDQFQGLLDREEQSIREDIESGIHKDQAGINSFFQYVRGKEVPNDLLKINNKALETREINCSNKDFRNKLPPVRNQGAVGWCYAYAAADLASFESGKNISAIDLALQYNHTQNVQKIKRGIRDTIDFSSEEGFNLNLDALSESLSSLREVTVKSQDCGDKKENCFNEAGFKDHAFLIGQKNGFCPESRAPSDSYQNKELSEILYGMRDLDHYIRANRGSRGNLAIAQDICRGEYGELIREAFPSTLIEDVVQILEHPQMTNSYQELTNKACRSERLTVQGSLISLTIENTGGQKNFRDQLNSALENDEVVMLSYSAKILSPYLSEDHASTIVGRRWNQEKQSCQYLIRNSHGNNCTGYHSTIDCEEGNLWINEEIILRNSYSASYLD